MLLRNRLPFDIYEREIITPNREEIVRRLMVKRVRLLDTVADCWIVTIQ